MTVAWFTVGEWAVGDTHTYTHTCTYTHTQSFVFNRCWVIDMVSCIIRFGGTWKVFGCPVVLRTACTDAEWRFQHSVSSSTDTPTGRHSKIPLQRKKIEKYIDIEYVPRYQKKRKVSILSCISISQETDQGYLEVTAGPVILALVYLPLIVVTFSNVGVGRLVCPLAGWSKRKKRKKKKHLTNECSARAL